MDGLQVSPQELKFRFEVRKNIPVVLSLTNPSGDKVAFKVKTTSPKTYCVRPSSGFVEPNSTMQVQIIRQAQREYPAVYGDTKDKFLVQSTKVTSETREIIPELFDSSKNTNLQQVKLRVALVGPPQPPSPVPEHPELPGDEDTNSRAFASADAPSTAVPGGSVVGGAGGSGDAKVSALLEEADKVKKENAELRRKLLASRPGGGGLNLVHLVLVALIAFLIGYFFSSR